MKLLKKLYRISSPSGQEKNMRKFIVSLLKGGGISYSVDKKGNIYATKGQSDSYPCVVCHIDEVHRERSKGYKVVETDGVIYGINTQTMAFEGIGADDKNGIWVCIKALSEFDVLKCAFFVSEEVGCVGSSVADMSFFENCRFVAQCDRKGNSDFISVASGVDLCSDEFLNDINVKTFGYKATNGMMTDVMELKKRGLNVSACNISCGYFNPHSNNEMTRYSDLQNCFELVKHIIRTCTKVYSHKYVKPVYKESARNFGGWGCGTRFYQPDIIKERLLELYPTCYKDVATGKYMVWSSSARKSVPVSTEAMMYAKNIDDYRGLEEYYDLVRFDKKGNPIVKMRNEEKFYAPPKDVLDAVLNGVTAEDDEYDEMFRSLEDAALADPQKFNLDDFILKNAEHYPHLNAYHYDMACQDVLGCLY